MSRGRLSSRLGRLALLGALAIFFLTAGMAGGADPGDPLQATIAENNTKLSDLRNQIEAGKARIKALENEASEVQRGYDEILQDIELSRDLLGSMAQQEATLLEQSELLKQDLAASGQTFQSRQQALARSLRSMYMRGQTGELEMFLTSDSFSDLVVRVRTGRMLARLEGGLLEKTREQGIEIKAEQRQLDSSLAEIWMTREEMSLEKGRMELLMAEQMASLRDLEDERKEVNNRLLELSLNEQKLTYILEDLEQQRIEQTAMDAHHPNSLAALAGDLEWPVQGEVVRGFGRSVHPRFKTVTLNNGINIAAANGSPVAAVADGMVEFADQLPGFGQCVILDHGAGYYTLYAHLDRSFVAAGAEIARGQVIAEVGRPPGQPDSQLYFEVRQGRTPLDPADWLLSR